MNEELELFKLVTANGCEYEYVDEMGWINEEEFCVWVSYTWVSEFMYELMRIFGHGIFDDGGFYANMQSNGICIDMCKALEGYIDLESVFPREQYQH